MPTLSDYLTNTTPREREALEQVLRPGEQLRWAIRPQPRLRDSVRAQAGLFFFSLLWLGILVLTLIQGMDEINDWDDIVVLSVFLLIGVGMFSVPFVKHARIRRSFYVLTARRALVLEPRLRYWEHYSWALHDRLLLRRELKPGGGGNLLFSREAYGRGQHCCSGLPGLPNLADAEERILAAVAAREQARRPGQEPAETTCPARAVEDILPSLTAHEKAVLERELFPDERGRILWAARSQRGLVSGGLQDLRSPIAFLERLSTLDFHTTPHIYVLTPRRALILEPQFPGGWRPRAYPLHRDLVIERRAGKQGRGDLIFEELVTRTEHKLCGFMNLPNLVEAEAALECALAARRG